MRASCPLQEEAGRDRVGTWKRPRYTRRHPGAGEPEGPQGQASQMGMKLEMMVNFLLVIRYSGLSAATGQHAYYRSKLAPLATRPN